MAEPTADAAAQWMLDEVQRTGWLYQEHAVSEIERQFGRNLIYERDLGAQCISRDVLKKFRLISDQTVIWSRGEKCWRLRHDWDQPGRRQD